ncbi:hypothetical protein [Sphingobium sp. CFD-1]|nr:hypothetical protein [Sphingobium sp. CFD-1]
MFGKRTSVNYRWLSRADREHLEALRLRYMKGDLSALEEVRT